jgi:hypothetical protein
MVTGQMPISGPEDRMNLKGWQKAHKENPRPNAMDDNPGCPPQLALLIMRMMSVKPLQRPSVEDCITILDSYRSYLTEKALSRFSIPTGLKSQIENGHTGTGQYNITFTPKFNSIFDPEVHLLCGTRLFVIRLQMDHPIFSEYRRLVQYLAEKFSDTFCMYEAYGAYDIHVLIWTDDERVNLLNSELKNQFAGSDVRINEAKDVYHLHEPNRRRDYGITLVGALAIQENVQLDGVSPRDYISEAYYPPETADHTIRAFTYVHALTKSSMDPMMLRTAILSSVRQRMLDLVRVADPTSGKKKFPRITLIEFTSDPRNFDEPVAMVNFVARDYHFIQELPTSIIELGGNAVKTSTFLETGRLVIQSDKILF